MTVPKARPESHKEKLHIHKAAEGVQLTVKGVVQGVGFRPFVYRLAKKYSFSGTVINCDEGVVIRLSPPLCRLANFLKELQDNAPPLATISSVSEQKIFDFFSDRFVILTSESSGTVSTIIPPDVACCADCLRELTDKQDRRYQYPFINCTNCGPRFSIVESIPYDRPATSMKVFPMCPDCQKEYNDPLDRRFHAQPNACWKCGPRLSWHDEKGREIQCQNPIAEAVGALKQGKIVAIRGLGGFHLAVDATNNEAVGKLRKRKLRQSKPLAVMVADIETASEFCVVLPEEAQLLSSRQRPIVLLAKKEQNDLSPHLAPGISHLGLILPYTPFHHLLFMEPQGPKALVMTSGNRSDEPICTSNAEALDKLTDLSDCFLLHNRDIVTRVDDSLVRFAQRKVRFMRRARGYVPEAVSLDCELPEVLACGAMQKNTFCFAKGNTAYLSQHIGDLNGVENFEFYEESIQHLKDVLEITPQVVSCDLHPDYLSTHYAEGLGLPLYRVQHHHAHAVAVMAEHGLHEETCAVILDGNGYGPDGTIWGGEILLAGLTSYKRLARLERLMQPGGDAAAKEPWRMALSVLLKAYGPSVLKKYGLAHSLTKIDAHKRATLIQMMEKNVNSPLTSSCGRLFDAVAALLDVCLVSDYEGQAAMELESLALGGVQGFSLENMVRAEHRLPVVFEHMQGEMVIRSVPLIRAIVDLLDQGCDRSSLSLAFHCWLISSIAAALRELGCRHNIKNVVLSGGCLQNVILLQGLTQKLEMEGFHVFSGEKVPVNDGGISLGQAVVAGMRELEKQSLAD
ncbi:MAG: carbamoyltransferase HypF [Desulfobulbaceae bacterium]|nr:carbamoyltransferase HypF [Desulfobulbaceae bacterium]